MALFGLTLALVLLQDGDAELLQRLQSVADRAADLDPFVRAEAAEEAVRLVAARERAMTALAPSKKTSALIVLALAGKSDGAALLRIPDRNARRVACDLIAPTKDSVPDLLSLLDAKDPGLRIAAGRALGRIEDGELRKKVSTAIGHGMRRAGSLDLLFAQVSSAWRGTGNAFQFPVGDSEPARATLAIAALCNVPNLGVTEAYAPALLRALENEKIDRASRSLLLRVLGRRSPWVLFPALSIRDRAFRSEMVDLLDRTLADPLVAPALQEAWRAATLKKLDDGKTPAKPMTAWIEAWMKRLCGDGVTPANFAEWHRTSYRAQIDRQADAAIRRGAEALRKMCEKDGAWRMLSGGVVGLHAFAVYALLKCDVPSQDPVVARSLDLLLERDPEGIYSTSLVAMALATAVEKGVSRRERVERRAQRIADILASSQLKSGGWSYIARVYPDQSVEGWSYDLSNTQFAILGLRAAANAGAKIPRTTWERARALLEKMQLPDGGWSYSGPDSPSNHSMTAAGAASWILCRQSLEEAGAPANLADSTRLRDALRWLERPNEASTMISPVDYYLLYSIERLCMIARIDKLGSRDWYAEGAASLLRAQAPEGSWPGSYGAVADTCMALLFLRKAFIARPDIATETARKRATPEEAKAVHARTCEEMFVEGVREIRVGSDADTSFILVIVATEADVRRLIGLWGKDVDGVPLRITVTMP
jgi:hypothetical protein